MNRILPTTFGFALLMMGSAQAAQEFRCVGPNAVTGKAIDSSTIVTPGFNCRAAAPLGNYADWGNAVPLNRHARDEEGRRGYGVASRASLFTVQFKDPAVEMKAGDPVTLTGIFFVVLDPAQHSAHLLVKDAEIVR